MSELQLAMERDDIDIDLREVDEGILDILEEGRCTRQHLAERLDVSGEYVYQRVSRLIEHGIVEKIHDGFYELATDGGQVVHEHERDNEVCDEISVDIDEIINRVEWSKNIDNQKARRESRRVVEHLRENSHRTWRKGQLQKALVDGDVDLGAESWWSRAALPFLQELRKTDLVEYDSGSFEYRWVG